MILMNQVTLDVQDDSEQIDIEVDGNSDDLNLEVKEQYGGGTSDYNKLKNKPKLNGNEIIGEVEEIDPTVPTWAKAETRPVYTPEDVGAMAEGSVTFVSTTELDELWNSL
jgi:hypothetical protein